MPLHNRISIDRVWHLVMLHRDRAPAHSSINLYSTTLEEDDGLCPLRMTARDTSGRGRQGSESVTVCMRSEMGDPGPTKGVPDCSTKSLLRSSL